LLKGLGSLSLLSIFILILVYWADILYEADDDFPSARRDAPVGAGRERDPLPLAMSLVNAVTLSAVSVV
jgi:hypothetical protein